MSGYIFLGLRIGMALALYAFLAWAIYTLWRTVKQQSRFAALPKIPVLTLIQVGNENGQTYRLSTPEALLGRDPACIIFLDDLAVSSRHARLFFETSQWWVQDLASRNGTYLNGELLTSPVVLVEGDRLQVGQVEMLITLIDPPRLASEKEKP